MRLEKIKSKSGQKLTTRKILKHQKVCRSEMLLRVIRFRRLWISRKVKSDRFIKIISTWWCSAARIRTILSFACRLQGWNISSRRIFNKRTDQARVKNFDSKSTNFTITVKFRAFTPILYRRWVSIWPSNRDVHRVSDPKRVSWKKVFPMQRARGFFQAVVFQGTEIRRPQKIVDKQNGQTGATQINNTKFTVDLDQNNRYQMSKRTVILV